MPEQQYAYELVFYDDESGRKPVLGWIQHELPREQRRALGTAMREVLQRHGVGVCGTEFGRQLGNGVFEFRLREEGLLLRVFCHAYGDKLVLLLNGYDKGKDLSGQRQEAEIEVARRRLRQWRGRRQTADREAEEPARQRKRGTARRGRPRR